MKISLEKEIQDIIVLKEKIDQDKWIDSKTIFVNCSPDYSSIVCQILNHSLSSTDLFEEIILEMPYPVSNQIFDRYELEYKDFDRYLSEWVKKYIDSDYKYLFIDSGTLRGKNFTKVRNQVKNKIDCKFASLYVQDDSIFIPDYYVEKFNFITQGGLIFEWENPKNKNWNY
jgi:hypothetical protein